MCAVSLVKKIPFPNDYISQALYYESVLSLLMCIRSHYIL